MVLAMLVPIFTSSDDDLEEVETAWTDVLEGIDNRPFGVDVAVPGCTFVLPEETNEFDFFKKFFRLKLMLLIVHETNEYARKQSAKNWAALMRVYRDTFTVVTPEKTLPAASQAMANFSTSDVSWMSCCHSKCKSNYHAHLVATHVLAGQSATIMGRDA